MNQHAHQSEIVLKTPQECMAETVAVCRQLGDLISSENKALDARDVKPVEANLKQKSRLAVKLEKLLSDMKAQKDTLKQHGDFKVMAQNIQKEMDGFQAAAKKNVLLLKTAHQTRADTLEMIRHAMDLQRPRTETYNKQGEVSKSNAGSSLINKAV
ncbi:MAG: hypothetical protein OXR68_01765 [Alphaproteobacteria bacterium]|nr:hypothetical protein [Alphaproteobacteria bacterium]MDD9919338.1 hypothetical protein [Alphaproteobacteria bacterium]